MPDDASDEEKAKAEEMREARQRQDDEKEFKRSDLAMYYRIEEIDFMR